ncbi:MAG: YfhO family protein [Acidobacteria bacterium]|nr:YfhO family protein [Acidobacteriota bacterium]
MWSAGGAGFVVGWKSALYPAVLLALFALGLCLVRSSQGHRRAWLSGALLLAVGADYKAFGTSKQFNARLADADETRSSAPFSGMATDVYRKLLADVDHRVAVDPLTGPHPTSLHLYGLKTPQGLDPMLPTQYSEKMKASLRPSDPRLLDLDPSNDALLRSLGVRYFITSELGLFYQALRANAQFRLLEPSDSFHQVFEIRDPKPVWRWEPEGRSDPASVERILWEPARREFRVESAAGGRFILVEQHYPGWRATIDSRPAAIERCEGAFQAIRVPAGQHRIVFEYKSRALLVGALITALSLAALCTVILRSTPRAR